MHPQLADRIPICSICGDPIPRPHWFAEKRNRWQAKEICYPFVKPECYSTARKAAGMKGGKNRGKRKDSIDVQKLKPCPICGVKFLGTSADVACEKWDCRQSANQAAKWGVPANQYHQERDRRNAEQLIVDNSAKNPVRGFSRVVMFSYAGLP